MSFYSPKLYGEGTPEKRSGHVTVFYKGALIVHGGYGDWEENDHGFVASKHIWVYEIATSCWSKHQTTGKHPAHSTGSCATVIENCMILFGGFYKLLGQTNKVFSLDLQTLVWSELTEKLKGPGPSAKDKLCSWQWRNNIYYFGGFGDPPDNIMNSKAEFCFEEFPEGFSRGFGWNNQLHVLNCNELLWSEPTSCGDIPCPRAATATAQMDHSVYLFGGRFKDRRRNDLFHLNLKSLVWTEIDVLTDKPCGRSWHILAPISDKHLLLYGGFDNEGLTLKDVWIYNCEEVAWHELPNASSSLGSFSPRMWHTVCNTDTPGEVLIFGGCCNSILGSEKTIHTNSLVIFHFSPCPLQRLCLEFVMQNISMYKSSLNDLPKLLREVIDQRSHTMGLYITKCNKAPTKCCLM